jgi:eukaryotic translation initiation factor 2C
MGNLVDSFHKRNSVYPQSIYFFRDALPQGQAALVAQNEVTAIQQILQTKGVDCKITYIGVQKQHHVRIVPAQGCHDAKDEFGNVRPGVVIDSQVTEPSDFDFFLQSHSGLKGAGMTRTPRYVVLHDDHKLLPTQVQSFTYQLCYMFARCTRSVSAPAPVYYAKIAADRARIYDGQDLIDDSASQSTVDSQQENPEARMIKIPSQLARTLFYV